MWGAMPPDGGIMEDDSSQFESLMEMMGNQINGKDVDTVVSVLALLLANAGCMGGLSPQSVLNYVNRIVYQVYDDNDPTDETIH
jgi:hypothetical protein